MAYILDFPTDTLLTNEITSLPASGDLISISGEGIIRSITINKIYNTSNLATAWATDTLSIYYGAEVTPSFSATLSQLFGMRYIPDAGTTFATDYLTVLTNEVIDGNSHISVKIDWPIPYTNGIRVSFGAVNGETTATITYQNGIAASWNHDFKLRSSRANADVGAAVAIVEIDLSNANKSIGLWPGGFGDFSDFDSGDLFSIQNTYSQVRKIVTKSPTTITFNKEFVETTDGYNILTTIPVGEPLDRPAGKSGYVVGSICSFSGSNYSILEGNPQAYIDGESFPSYEFPGTEDYFNCPFYGLSEYATKHGGLIYRNGTDVFNCFRIHDLDPIRYDNGIAFQWPNAGEEIANISWLTLYYEKD